MFALKSLRRELHNTFNSQSLMDSSFDATSFLAQNPYGSRRWSISPPAFAAQSTIESSSQAVTEKLPGKTLHNHQKATESSLLIDRQWAGKNP